MSVGDADLAMRCEIVFYEGTRPIGVQCSRRHPWIRKKAIAGDS